MQQTSTSGNSSMPDFAGVLTSLTDQKEPEPAPWNDDALAEDIATLSYEQALRTHTTYTQEPAAYSQELAAPLPSAPEKEPSLPTEPIPEITEKPLKSASITIRLSATECAQLRQRAAEAGLTVSAYLRSCTLEVESLRAQVKETLAELRNANAVPQETGEAAPAMATTVKPGFWKRMQGVVGVHRTGFGLNPVNPLAPAVSHAGQGR